MSLLSPPTFYLKVYIGKELAKTPIPSSLAGALTRAEVDLSDEVPSGFQLEFSAQPSAEDNDYDLMKEPLLAEFNRVVLEMLVDDKPKLLMDGFITHKELDQDAGKVVVTGEDLSLKMDLFEISKEYPEKTDSAIVNEILGRYSPLAFTRKVTAPRNEVAPLRHTPHQLDTDREFLLKLARRNDCRFYVRFGAGATAYWGPPERDGAAQPALVSNAVMFGNVERLEPGYDPMAAVLYYGSKLADGDGGQESAETPFGAEKYGDTTLSKAPVPLGDFAALAADPGSFESRLSTLKVRGRYVAHQHLNASRVAAAAQAATDRDGAQAATIEGELDTARYGHVLQTPGIVGVRGAGEKFDGNYYVQSVTHKMNLKRGEVRYMQSFRLVREGTGAKKSTVST